MILTFWDWISALYNSLIEDGEYWQREDIHQSIAEEKVDRVLADDVINGQREPHGEGSSEEQETEEDQLEALLKSAQNYKITFSVSFL